MTDLDYIYPIRAKQRGRGSTMIKRSPDLPTLNLKRRLKKVQIGVLDRNIAIRILQQGGRPFDLWSGLEWEIKGNTLSLKETES